jgi:hypothetical protein
MPVTWQAAIIFTHYSMASLIAHFFILLISSVIVVPSVCAMLYYTVDAQLPLQPQAARHSEHSLFQL